MVGDTKFVEANLPNSAVSGQIRRNRGEPAAAVGGFRPVLMRLQLLEHSLA